MPIRWRWILPLCGLVLFGWETYASLKMNRDLASRNHARREFLWGTFRLRTDPLGKIAPLPCPPSIPNCAEWLTIREVIVDPGLVLEALLFSSLPAFVVALQIVHGLGRLGVNEVRSFFVVTPVLIVAWQCYLGWLLDRWRYKRQRKPAVAN